MTTEGRLTMINCKMLFYHLMVMMAFIGYMEGGRLKCYQCSGFDTKNCMEPGNQDLNPGICEGSSCVSLILRDDKNTELERMRFCSNILTSSKPEECLWDHNNMQHTCICSQVDKCNNYRSEYEARSEGTEYTCYQCSGDQCKLSNDKLQTCKGSACMTVTLEFNGKSETLRACSFKNRDIKSGCVNDVIYQGAVKRKTCRCMGDYCNGSNEVKDNGSNGVKDKDNGSNGITVKDNGSNGVKDKDNGSNGVKDKDNGSNGITVKDNGSNGVTVKDNGSNGVKAKVAYLMTFVTFLMSVVLRG